MVKRYRKWLLGLIIAVLCGLSVWDLLGNRGPGDLIGGFEEVAFVRNEQNKGGIIRVYAFSVADTIGADYIGCGNLLPHNDYGSITTAYFFESGKPIPDLLDLEPPHFDTTRYQPVAVYNKGDDGVGKLHKISQAVNQEAIAPSP